MSELLYALADRLERLAKLVSAFALASQEGNAALLRRQEQWMDLLLQDRLATDRQTAEFRSLLVGIATYEAGLRSTAVRARFVTISHKNLETGEDLHMPTNLVDDAISVIPLEFDNVGGQKVTPPTGTGSVSNDNPAAGTVAMSADGLSVEFTPAQPAVDGATGNLTFVEGTLTATMAYAVTTDPAAANVHFVTSSITTLPLPVTPPAGP